MVNLVQVVIILDKDSLNVVVLGLVLAEAAHVPVLLIVVDHRCNRLRSVLNPLCENGPLTELVLRYGMLWVIVREGLFISCSGQHLVNVKCLLFLPPFLLPSVEL